MLATPTYRSDILYATNVTTGPILTTPLLTVDEQNYYPKNEGQVDSGRLTAWLVLDVIKTLSIFGSWLITFSCALSTDNMEGNSVLCQYTKSGRHVFFTCFRISY